VREGPTIIGKKPKSIEGNQYVKQKRISIGMKKGGKLKETRMEYMGRGIQKQIPDKDSRKKAFRKPQKDTSKLQKGGSEPLLLGQGEEKGKGGFQIRGRARQNRGGFRGGGWVVLGKWHRGKTKKQVTGWWENEGGGEGCVFRRDKSERQKNGEKTGRGKRPAVFGEATRKRYKKWETVPPVPIKQGSE